MRKFFPKVYATIVALVILLAPVSPLITVFPVKATSYSPLVDVFASQYVTGNWRWYNSIGYFFDTVGNYRTGRSETYLKFNLSNIPSNAIITNAVVKIYKYANGGSGFNARLARLSSDINTSTGSTLNDFKTKAENYGNPIFVNSNDLDYQEVSFDIRTLAQSWINGTYPNFGVAIYADVPNGNLDQGASLCSTRTSGAPWCNGWQPRLEISYFVNVAPIAPNITSPQDGEVFGAGLNAQCVNLGECSINFTIIADDPDDTFPLSTTVEVRSNSGENRDFNFTGEGTQSFQRNLSDGIWSIKARSVDSYLAQSPYSVTKNIIVDNTPPSVPSMLNEPEFTAGDQNRIKSTQSVDLLIGGVEYYFEISKSSTFQDIIQSSGWITTNAFTFGNLEDNTQYFFRNRSRDSLNNTSAYSNIVNSTQDSISPEIEDLFLSVPRISPKNQDGVDDFSFLNLKWRETNLENITINLKNSTLEILKTYNITSTETSSEESILLDGKDNSDQFLDDGVYIVEVILEDKAQNRTIDDSHLLIIDNTPANLSISRPHNSSWFSSEQILISGQTESDANLVIENIITQNSEELSLDQFGIFATLQDIFPGSNKFKLIAKDITGNLSDLELEVFRENQRPTIEIGIQGLDSANNLTNNTFPKIELKLKDSGETVSDEYFYSGINRNSISLSIKHSDLDSLYLINEGYNTASELGNFTTSCPEVIDKTKAELECLAFFEFTSPLQPDGIYKIFAQVSDIAGNLSNEYNFEFELDSRSFLEVEVPKTQTKFNFSKIFASGSIERYAELKIYNLESTDYESLYVQEEGEFGRVKVSNCRNSDSPSRDGIKEICDWFIHDFQLDRNIEFSEEVKNNLIVEARDLIGNTSVTRLELIVDLFDVALNIDTNLDFISPNGDGIQDALEFRNISATAQVLNYKITIQNSNLETVRTFSGDILPPNIFWDATNQDGSLIPDGTYIYFLEITSTDLLSFKSNQKSFVSITKSDSEVFITFPTNDSFSTRGVTNIQGIGPKNQNLIICNDVIGLPSDCDYESSTHIQNDGTFSLIHPLILLPDTNTTEHIIYAYSIDEFGNKSPKSNEIKITYTINPPFNNIYILPAFTGVNNESDYQNILDKINNGEEITQTDIDSLRTVVFRSSVNLGTERVIFRFADHSNLNSLPSETQFRYLGYVNHENKTNFLKSYSGNSSEFCPTNDCIWDFVYPVPYMSGGGIFEIEFDGKLGSTIQKQTAPLKIDANIPTSPLILDIDKFENNMFVNTNFFENKFYSNKHKILIKGVSDPNANIKIYDQENTLICDIQSTEIGLFFCNTDIYSDGKYFLKTFATLGANTSESFENTSLVIDTKSPNIQSSEVDNVWKKSGDKVEIKIQVDEPLRFSVVMDKVENGCTNSRIMQNSWKYLNLNQTKTTAINYFDISGNSLEGEFCLTAYVYDLAGNYTEEIIKIFIDNSVPDTPIWDKQDWGKFSGKFAKEKIPAKSRLTPEYVFRENILEIRGYVEELTRIELFVDSKLEMELTMPARESKECKKMYEDKEFDNVIVKSGFICEFQINYSLKTEKGYLFKLRSIDRSGNFSNFTFDTIVYLDTTKPITPQTISADVKDWQYATFQNVTASNLGTGNNGKLPITNKSKIKIEDFAESRSDIEYSFSAPNGNIVYTSLIEKSGSGIDTLELDLNAGDGVYTFESESWDSAGNKSGKHKWQLEKDSIAPRIQEAVLELCNNSICLNILGEIGSNLFINNYFVGKISSNSQKFIILNNFKYSTKYNFEITLSDRAGNQSQKALKSITTPDLGIGMGDGVLGDSTDHYGAKTSDIYDNLKWDFQIRIDKNGEETVFSNMPIPIITYTSVLFGSEDVEVFGIAPRKNQKIQSNITIVREFMGIKEAEDLCRVEGFLGLIRYDNDCLRKNFGMVSEDEAQKQKEECYRQFPYIFGDYYDREDCLSKIYTVEAYYKYREIICSTKFPYILIPTDEYNQCMYHEQYHFESKYQIEFNIDSLEMLLSRRRESNIEDITNNRYCDFGQKCHNNSNRYWNDDVQGKWKMKFNRETLKKDDKIFARFKIFTEIQEVEFMGAKRRFKINGALSNISNILTIGSATKFEDLVVSPVRNCSSAILSSKFGNRTFYWPERGIYYSDFHTGIDLAKPGGCDINSALNGQARSSNYAGLTIEIKHNDEFTTRYGHAAYYIGQFPRYVNTGEVIIYMGKTGMATGVHLHFEVLRFGNFIDPLIYFGKFLN